MNGVNPILFATSALVTALVIFSVFKKDKSQGLRLFLFWGMTLPIIAATLYLAGATVAKNLASQSSGPVHWHADFEIYNCGRTTADRDRVKGRTILAHAEEEEIDLKNPEGVSNRIGSSNFHEHGDNRIHVEGVVEKLTDVSLGKFFEVIGGQLTNTFLRLPTDQGETILQNGRLCPEGKPGVLQVFLYQTHGSLVIQKKLENFVDYVISPHSQVPPGDCLIFEFGPVKDKTDKICKFYDIAIKKGELKYGN